MKKIFYDPDSLIGDNGANTLFATHAAADALYNYHVGPVNSYDIISIWDRTVRSYNGDDLIIRDRPGDYKADGFVGGERFGLVPDGADVTLSGNVLISGGNGNDTVSYLQYGGGIDIDLKPVAQDTWNEPWFWNGHADVAGTAKANGVSGQTIHGFDYLVGIENADGTNYGDKIKGTDDSNTIHGHDGNDQIWGRGGHDFLYGGDGRDHVYGGDGNDTIDGGEGNNVIKGEKGNDSIVAGSGHDTIEGGDGNDIIVAGGGNDTVYGGADNDTIFGGGGYNKLYGDGGDDDIYIQGSGNAYGGDGADEIWGSNTNNFIHTGGWDDGIDTVYAGGGNDTIVAGKADIVDGGAGRDELSLKNAPNKVMVTVQSDGTGEFQLYDGVVGSFTNIEDLRLGSNGSLVKFFDDVDHDIYAGNGRHYIYSGGGNDTIRTGHQADIVSGGDGDDTINTNAGNDFVHAGEGDDTINSRNGDNFLYGENGKDTIKAGKGNDTIYGGKDADTLTGGAGRDGFIYEEGDYGLDTITDFVIGEDYIDVRDFLKNPVPAGGSYAGKVVAFQTWDGDDVVLSAETIGGWKSFAKLENHSVNDVYAAIRSGKLFDHVEVNYDGPGGWQPDSPNSQAPVGGYIPIMPHADANPGEPGKSFDLEPVSPIVYDDFVF